MQYSIESHDVSVAYVRALSSALSSWTDGYYGSHIARWILLEINVKSCTWNQRTQTEQEAIGGTWLNSNLYNKDWQGVISLNLSIWACSTNVLFKCSLRNSSALIRLHLGHCSPFPFPRDFDRWKINMEVCVRDGGEDICTMSWDTVDENRNG